MLVGEVFLTDQARVAPYLRPDELQLAFNFSLVFQPWDAAAIRRSIDASLRRAADRDVGAREPRRHAHRHALRASARRRAAALLLLALPGPAFLYQGQELGLEEVDLPDELRQDPVFQLTGGAQKGRDGCRVPIPWSAPLPERSWLPQPPIVGRSLRRGAARRPALDALALPPRARAAAAAARSRGARAPRGRSSSSATSLVCAVNVDAPSLALPAGELLLASDEVADSLPPGTAAWLRR